MKKLYLTSTLAGIFTFFGGSIGEVKKDTFETFFNNSQTSIERTVEASTKHIGIDGLLGGVVYGEEKEKSNVDYDKLAKSIENMNFNKDFDTILSILQPYENDPNNKSSIFYTNIGLAYTYKGRKSQSLKNHSFKMAEFAYKKAIKLNPLLPHPRVNLGVLYLYELKDLKSAQEQFNFVLQNIDSGNKPAKYYLNKSVK